MIDIQATIEKFGYNPNTLKSGSSKMVVNVCQMCGNEKDIRYFTTKRENWSGLCVICRPKTDKARKNRSDYMMGRATNTGMFSGEKNYFYGKHLTGEQSGNWRGGISSKNNLIRSSQEYKDWRLSVFERDNYTCQECGDSTGGNLNGHHILPRRDYPEKVFDINNGITLCVECHKKTLRKEYQFVDKYLKILGFFAQKCAFINRVNSGDTSSETILSQAYPETDLKVQRLTAESIEDSNADTSALHPKLDDDIV